MNKPLPPFLRFAPIYKDYIWGGNRIATRYSRSGIAGRIAESWEISAHPDGDSIVASGPFAGHTLSSLVRDFGRTLLGAISPSAERFPLLCKIIDAAQPLSVQVHPSPADPSAPAEEYKNECWHILDSEPATTIFAGLTPAASSPQALRELAAAGNGALAKALLRHSPHWGETLFIPAGLVHAIGAGSLIYEVQQNSNTTYRLYDWDRIGPDGHPRALHFDAALRSIDFALPPPAFVAPQPIAAPDASQAFSCLKTEYFTITEFRGPTMRLPNGQSFEILFVKSGTWHATASNDNAECGEILHAGDSLLVPASNPGYTLSPQTADAAILVTTL